MGNNLNKPKVAANGKSIKGNSLLNAAKNADYVFISVMGPHASEKPDEIYKRKTADIVKCGKSFWVSKIYNRFIDECKNHKAELGDLYLILVESSGNGKSAVDTKVSKRATKYSEKRTKWEDIDTNISKVTGNLPKNGATAYYFDDIEMCNDSIDLNKYSEYNTSQALAFLRGKSNVFAKKHSTPLPGGMKSHERKIVAVLSLKAPYVVWVK